jgi:hypothetical protein
VADYRDADGDRKLTPGSSADEFIRFALKRFKASAEGEATLRAKMLKDKKFFAGEHWDPRQQTEREEQGLPCLVIDRLKQPKRQITNGLMAARPAIQINAIDDGADVETAQAIQGLVRNIERQSHAEVVYATGADDAVVCGRGFWRVDVPWANEDGEPDPNDPAAFFRQEIRLKRIRNQFTVYPDARCQEVDYRDARYYFVIEDVPVDEFDERYPNSKACKGRRGDSAGALQSIGDEVPDWFTDKAIRIAEYWYIDLVRVTMALISVPQPDVLDEQTGKMVEQPPKMVVIEKERGQAWPAGVTEIDTRPAMKRKVKWACINGIEVLEGNDQKTAGREWAGRWIPIIPCLGEEFDIGGRVDLRGMVRDAMDAQRVQDYEVSDLIEKQMLASRAPYIMAEGQIEGYAGDWAVANTKRLSHLLYKPQALGGALVPPPQRNAFEPAIQATLVGIQQSAEWIMASTGFHEPNLGMQGPQESGKAIMARQRQGEIGSSNYAINLSHAIRFTGEIIVDLIPHYYDEARSARILGLDDREKQVMFHAGKPPSDEERAAIEAQGVSIYDISTGRYDVAVGQGTSKDTQRQEAVEMLTTAMQANPAMWQIAGDLYWKFVDLPVARELAERFKLMLDPRVQQGDGKQPDPRMLMAQMQQMQQQLQQGQQAYQQLQQAMQSRQLEVQAKAETDMAQTQAELASKERLEMAKMENDRAIAEIKANTDLIKTQASIEGQQSLAVIKAQLDELAQRLDYDRQDRVAGRADARADVHQMRSERREDAQREREAKPGAEDR